MLGPCMLQAEEPRVPLASVIHSQKKLAVFEKCTKLLRTVLKILKVFRKNIQGS